MDTKGNEIAPRSGAGIRFPMIPSRAVERIRVMTRHLSSLGVVPPWDRSSVHERASAVDTDLDSEEDADRSFATTYASSAPNMFFRTLDTGIQHDPDALQLERKRALQLDLRDVCPPTPPPPRLQTFANFCPFIFHFIYFHFCCEFVCGCVWMCG